MIGNFRNFHQPIHFLHSWWLLKSAIVNFFRVPIIAVFKAFVNAIEDRWLHALFIVKIFRDLLVLLILSYVIYCIFSFDTLLLIFLTRLRMLLDLLYNSNRVIGSNRPQSVLLLIIFKCTVISHNYLVKVVPWIVGVLDCNVH